MIESSDRWLRDYAAFLFRDTTPTDIDKTLRSLGAHSKSIDHRSWAFPGQSSPLLRFSLIEDFDTYCAELIFESLGWYAPLLDALGVDYQDALLLYVSVRDEPEAFLALHTFALRLLEDHHGAVKDAATGRVWTRHDLAELRVRKDWTRLAGHGGGTGNTEPE